MLTHNQGGIPKKAKITPHKCPTCCKAFQKPSQLERHIRVHTGQSANFSNEKMEEHFGIFLITCLGRCHIDGSMWIIVSNLSLVLSVCSHTASCSNYKSQLSRHNTAKYLRTQSYTAERFLARMLHLIHSYSYFHQKGLNSRYSAKTSL